MKLSWTKCPCGAAICKLEYPTNLGSFYMGTGFQPEEKALLDRAFGIIEQMRDVVEAQKNNVTDDHILLRESLDTVDLFLASFAHNLELDEVE